MKTKIKKIISILITAVLISSMGLGTLALAEDEIDMSETDIWETGPDLGYGTDEDLDSLIDNLDVIDDSTELPEELTTGTETTSGDPSGSTLEEATGAGSATEGTTSGSSTPPSSSQDASSLDSFNVTQFLTISGEQDQSYLTGESSNSPIMQFILTIINFLTKIIGTVCMVLIIIGGLMMVASEGDDNRVQKGKTIIFQAIIGLILALTSYILVTFVQSLLYVNG